VPAGPPPDAVIGAKGIEGYEIRCEREEQKAERLGIDSVDERSRTDRVSDGVGKYENHGVRKRERSCLPGAAHIAPEKGNNMFANRHLSPHFLIICPTNPPPPAFTVYLKFRWTERIFYEIFPKDPANRDESAS